MSDREPVRVVEIDVDQCSLTYGTAPCAAVLGTTGVRKCFNMYRHCQDQENFTRQTLTLRFIEPGSNVPIGYSAFPCLLSVSSRSSTVNIAGLDDRLSAFGRRASVEVRLADFPHDDRGIDPYQSGRVDGTAQTDEGGYRPYDRGTFFAKLRTRWPYYSGRALRVIEGYLDGGVLANTQVRNYIITDWAVNQNGSVSIRAKDVLHLADRKSAVCPHPSNGELAAGISSGSGSLTLSPAGIGDAEYPSSGFAAIGSELVQFTRAGDTVTLVARGVSGTTAAPHDAQDKFQISFSPRLQRIDTVLADLLANYAGVDSAYIPTATWAAEVDIWAGGLSLTTDIIRPTPVADLVEELAVLGISVWWDEVAQDIGLKMLRPAYNEPIFNLTDDSAIKSVEIEDRDEDRLTEVTVYSVMNSAADDPSDPKSYARSRYMIDLDSKAPNAYGDTRLREITTRWLNHGDDINTRLIGRRALQRMRSAPVRYRLTLDAKDRDTGLTDVLRIVTGAIRSDVGLPETKSAQVVGVEQGRSGHEFLISAQSYDYDGRLAWLTENTVPVYASASDAQKDPGWFLVDAATLKFSDATGPYELI